MATSQHTGEDIHAAARQGFGGDAPGYARARPSYPDGLDSWLVDRLNLRPGRVVLELGAGTGKFTEKLRATGARVVAVEPVAEMRAQLHAALPNVEVRTGRAEATGLACASVDAIVCAQAFHWFANTAALDEMARVLRVGGALALIWNARDERIDWVSQLTAMMTPYEGDTPRHRSGDWFRLFPHAHFAAPSATYFEHAHVGPPEQVIVGRTLSTSFIAALPTPAKTRFADESRDLIASTPSLAGKAEVRFPYRTEAWITIRTA